MWTFYNVNMENIFKSYDIRGIYPTEIDEDIVYHIGRAGALYLKAKTIAVGRDNRDSSEALTDALFRGITDAGCNVIDLGLLSTPMLYFASTNLPVDAAMMITASHNPKQYNGIKICKKNAAPVGLTSGLSDIRDMATTKYFTPAITKGVISKDTIFHAYELFISSFADFRGKKFSIVTDTAHAMGVLELPILENVSGITIVQKLYGTLEEPGTCPHEANPLKTETLTELEVAVRNTHADMGIAFDGDADRIGFTDENGRPIRMDLITTLLAIAILQKFPGATILYDLRSSRGVKEVIEAHGGVAHECMVGHANIKKQMIDEGAIFAGELSGHYYFSFGGYVAEKGVLPAILLLNLMAQTNKKLSALVADVERYAHSGEINFEAPNAPALMAKLKNIYSDGILSTRDGIKIEYAEWWFSVRTSNTEPLLRLNIEAKDEILLAKKTIELRAALEQ